MSSPVALLVGSEEGPRCDPFWEVGGLTEGGGEGSGVPVEVSGRMSITQYPTRNVRVGMSDITRKARCR